MSVARRWPSAIAVGAAGAAGTAAGGVFTGLVAVAAMLGVPLFAVMAAGAELAWTLAGAPLNRLAPKVLEEQFAGSPVLVTVPLFTFLGYVLAESQAPRRIVAAALATGSSGLAAIETWVAAHKGKVDRARRGVQEIAESGLTLSKLAVAANLISELAS